MPYWLLSRSTTVVNLLHCCRSLVHFFGSGALRGWPFTWLSSTTTVSSLKVVPDGLSPLCVALRFHPRKVMIAPK